MATFPPAPDEGETLQLLAGIEDGDRAAWDALYRRYHDRLLLGVRMRLGDGLRSHLQSEDVLQSVVLEAFTSLRGFDYRGPGSLHRYLQRMVLNKVRDLADRFGAVKRAGTVPLDEAGVVDPVGEEVRYYDAEAYERLERALAALPDDAREILLLRKIDGLSSKEVAESTGRSDAAVRKSYSRALAKLTTLMVGGDAG